MEPITSPINSTALTACVDCGADLEGNRWRCPACVRAAETAVREMPGRVIRPSDIDRIRERDR